MEEEKKMETAKKVHINQQSFVPLPVALNEDLGGYHQCGNFLGNQAIRFKMIFDNAAISY